MDAPTANGQAIAAVHRDLHYLDTAAQTTEAIAIAITLVLLWLLVRTLLNGILRPRALHRDERASASLEFLLVFFPLLVLVLAVWQLAFMINAQIHVDYAAYAAARSASTIAFMELPDEPEGVLLNRGEPGAEKWQRIERAAIPGTLAISPGNAESAAMAFASSSANAMLDGDPAPNFDASDLGSIPGQLTLMTVHRGDAMLKGTRVARTLVKALYAQAATRVLINGRDANGRQLGGGRATNPLDLSNMDTLDVTVKYDFWLNVPYAGRAMNLAFGGNPVTSGTSYPTMTLSRTVTTPTWPQLKAY